jgi:hypothetical protein
VREARLFRRRPTAPSIDPTNDPTASFDVPLGELSKPRITSSHAEFRLWARLVSNQRPLACEAARAVFAIRPKEPFLPLQSRIRPSSVRQRSALSRGISSRESSHGNAGRGSRDRPSLSASRSPAESRWGRPERRAPRGPRYLQHLGHRRAPAALAAGLDLLPAVLTPPRRSHPEEPMGLTGHRAEHPPMIALGAAEIGIERREADEEREVAPVP